MLSFELLYLRATVAALKQKFYCNVFPPGSLKYTNCIIFQYTFIFWKRLFLRVWLKMALYQYSDVIKGIHSVLPFSVIRYIIIKDIFLYLWDNTSVILPLRIQMINLRHWFSENDNINDFLTHLLLLFRPQIVLDSKENGGLMTIFRCQHGL